MNDEIEILKYIYTNIKIQQNVLYKLLRRKEIKDDTYQYIKNLVLEYKKITLSSKRMLEVRIKKYSEEPNILEDIATSLGATMNIATKNDNDEFLILVRNNSEINLMDLERLLIENKIKSKTLEKLVERIEKIEKKNIESINLFL